MRKYRARVEIIKEYEIEIDDQNLTEQDLADFESVMYKLDEYEDKYASLAYNVARNQAMDLGFEGIGYPMIKGNVLTGEENRNINISSVQEYDGIDIMNEGGEILIW